MAGAEGILRHWLPVASNEAEMYVIEGQLAGGRLGRG